MTPNSKAILVTGAKGFIGTHLCRLLINRGYKVLPIDKDNTEDELSNSIKQAFFLVHLAGINRPLEVGEFYDGNVNFTKKVIDLLGKSQNSCPILLASSTQASLDNDYGRSKKMAEELFLQELSKRKVYVYRFYNVYGPGCRPNYNSVVATWCDSLTHGRECILNAPDKEIDFVYVGDVCEAIINAIEGKFASSTTREPLLYPEPHDRKALGEVLSLLESFKASRFNLEIPFQAGFVKKLYATYISYIPVEDMSYPLESHVDNRGAFYEAFHFPGYGQISINICHPGMVKGRHYHETKNEKYLCVSGEALVKLRKLSTDQVITHCLSATHPEVIDIPPGYIHSIETVGDVDSITVMWANEPYDPLNPDTYPGSI